MSKQTWRLVGPLSWFVDGFFTLCRYMREGARGLPGVSVIRTLIPSWGLPSHDLLTAQRRRLLPPSVGVRFQHMKLEGT